jgi:diaminopimelate epimerase
MKLFKAHGLGNDYLVLETGEPLTPEQVRAVCDRTCGVGSDGVLEPMATAEADHGVRIWNPDGSIAEKSGNGLRIFAWWLHYRRGATTRFTVWTGTDRVSCHVVGPRQVVVDMGRATVGPLESLTVGSATVVGRAVSIGNPHFVMFHVEHPPDWRTTGALLEVHPRFPNRTNVQFARRLADDQAEIRIWERGAGETSASGSSSCAVAAAMVFGEGCTPGWKRIHMPGGTLRVEVSPDAALRLDGPVCPVAEITLLDG